MQQNRVFLNDQNFIEIQVVGAQTEDTIRAMGSEVERLMAALVSQNQPVRLLDDLTRLTQADGPARSLLVELGKQFNYDKFAMFGGNKLIRLGSNLLFRAIGKGKELHYFSTRSEAVDWLLQE